MTGYIINALIGGLCILLWLGGSRDGTTELDKGIAGVFGFIGALLIVGNISAVIALWSLK